MPRFNWSDIPQRRPCSTGLLNDQKGFTYIGEYHPLSKVREGYGITIADDGTFYEGQYVNGVLEGPGRRIAKDGEIYEGAFSNNLPEGKGTLTQPSGNVYTG